MKELLIQVIQNLENQNEAIADLQTRAYTTFYANEARHLLKELKLRIEICHDTRCKEELPYYYILASYCYIIFEKFNEAEKYGSMAIDNFRVCGMSWNEGIGHWFLGLIYRIERRGYLYITELNKSLEILNPITAEHRIRGNYADAMHAEDVVRSLEEQKQFAQKMGTGPLHPPPDKKTKEDTSNFDYLILPWLPKYEDVQAGPKGIVWVDPPSRNSSAVTTIEIEGKSHKIFSIRSSLRTTDRQISLSANEGYGWARVNGHSMNACEPIPFDEGDHVLFSMRVDVENNNIVIAANVSFGILTHMVKKYDARNRLLISKTTDTSQDYTPLSLENGYHLIGTVIAVAKPLK